MSIQKLNLESKTIRSQLAKVSQSLDPKVPPPNGGVAGKQWISVQAADVMVVPTAGEAFYSFIQRSGAQWARGVLLMGTEFSVLIGM